MHFIQTHPKDKRFDHVTARTASADMLQSIVSDLRNSDAADWAISQARKRIQPANEVLGKLPHSIYRDALEELTTFAVKRRH